MAFEFLSFLPDHFDVLRPFELNANTVLLGSDESTSSLRGPDTYAEEHFATDLDNLHTLRTELSTLLVVTANLNDQVDYLEKQGYLTRGAAAALRERIGDVQNDIIELDQALVEAEESLQFNTTKEEVGKRLINYNSRGTFDQANGLVNSYASRLEAILKELNDADPHGKRDI